MHRLMRPVPNVLTVARLCALPFAVWTYARAAPGAAWATGFIVLFAALSDVADGLVARAYQVQSEFGRMGRPHRRPRLLLHPRGHAVGLRHAAVVGRGAPARARRDHPRAGVPDASLHQAGTSDQPWGKTANLVLVAALEWFIIDLRPLGWIFLAVGVVLYVGTGLLYGYRAVVWATRARGRGDGRG